MDLFDTPIRKAKVNKHVYAYEYRTGVIVIAESKYIGYSMREAIKLWRNKQKTIL